MESWLELFARANFLRSSDTAHDLKTPLNVAVLNLELLRMRMRKVAGEDDEKLTGYARSIETELRRMARIFDTFFLLSTPPKNEGEPHPIDIAPILADFGVNVTGPLRISAHESRIRQALKLFFDGTANVLEGRTIETSHNTGFSLVASGTPVGEDFELTKIFKFYYTDPNGNPDLSLAASRLIAETYGGELSAVNERDKVAIRMVFPLGEE